MWKRRREHICLDLWRACEATEASEILPAVKAIVTAFDPLF